MKKFLATVILALMILTTSAFAHKWEWAAYNSSSPNVGTVYIDSESVINVQRLFNVGDACIQALFKAPDGTIFFANFLRQGTNLYLAAEPVSESTLKSLNLPTVGQLEENRYRELRSKGASPRQAERILGRERAGHREELARKYTEAIMTYGTDRNGSLNLLGVSLLYKMAAEGLQGAGLFAQSLAFSPNYETRVQGGLASDLYKSAVAKLMLSSR